MGVVLTAMMLWYPNMNITNLAKGRATQGVVRAAGRGAASKGRGAEAASGRLDSVKISQEAKDRADGRVPKNSSTQKSTYRSVNERQVEVAAKEAFSRQMNGRRYAVRSRRLGFAAPDVSVDPKKQALNDRRKAAFHKDRTDGFEARASRQLEASHANEVQKSKLARAYRTRDRANPNERVAHKSRRALAIERRETGHMRDKLHAPGRVAQETKVERDTRVRVSDDTEAARRNLMTKGSGDKALKAQNAEAAKQKKVAIETRVR